MNNFPMEYWLNFSHVDRGKQYLIIPERETAKNQQMVIELLGSMNHLFL